MDSLLASYASSDEEKDEKSQQSNPPKPKLHAGEDTSSKSSGFFSSLPPPKSKSSLFSLPPPKSNLPKPPISSSSSIQHISNKKEEEEEGQKSLENPDNLGLSASFPKPSSSLFSSLSQPKSSPSSSLFSSLPQPKTHDTDAQILSNSSLGLQRPAAKRVVQFRPPPINPSSNVGNEDEDEDDESEEEEKKTKQSLVQTSSVKSFLSSIPAPRNSATLGALPSASGTGRRSIIDADVPGLKDSSLPNAGTVGEASVNTSVRNFEGQSGDDQTAIGSRGGGSDLSGYAAGGGDYSSWGSGSESFANYAGYGGYVNGDGVAGDYQNYDDENVVNYSVNYENYANYEQYERNWADGSTATVAPEVSGFAENALRVSGKRGRNNTPQEIIEVKQDELMKNRPREDQIKLTGIAFGPAYQPTSTKGKPTKLHKRKHQIGSLYFDMKQKEMELAERRAQGFLTKAQTQGKYGW